MDPAPRKSSSREVVEAAASGFAGMVPVAGSPLAAAFALAMGWTYNKRWQTWLDDLAAAVTELQEREGVTLEELRQSEVFVDAVVHASRSAQATHSDEKLRALRNAVVNSVDPGAPSRDEQAQFFRYVDQLTPSHLTVLAFMDDPAAMFAAHHRSIEGIGERDDGGPLLESLHPEFTQEWRDILESDLMNMRLVGWNFLAMMTDQGLWQSLTSGYGKRFLAFIADGE